MQLYALHAFLWLQHGQLFHFFSSTLLRLPELICIFWVSCIQLHHEQNYIYIKNERTASQNIIYTQQCKILFIKLTLLTLEYLCPKCQFKCSSCHFNQTKATNHHPNKTSLMRKAQEQGIIQATNGGNTHRATISAQQPNILNPGPLTCPGLVAPQTLHCSAH